MAFPNADSLAAMLRPVRIAFLETLADHIVAFDEIAGLPLELWSDEGIEDIARRAHKIAGVAGTLGYTQLGYLAASLEEDLRQRKHMGRLAEMLERTIHEMRAALDG